MSSEPSHFSAVLRSAGLKATSTRLSVLQALTEIGGHCSADQVYQFLATAGERVPRGTVFKVMADLSAKGILMLTDVGPGRTLYEYADEWHHHFVCRHCQTIMDIPCMEGRKPCLLPDFEFLGKIDEAQIIFRGYCKDCLSHS